MKNAIVLARMENTGLRETGRLVRPDGVNWEKELETCGEPKALVFSRDIKSLERAKTFAAQEGYVVMILPDTADVLSVARAKVAERR